jgi:hypothetical protein
MPQGVTYFERLYRALNNIDNPEERFRRLSRLHKRLLAMSQKRLQGGDAARENRCRLIDLLDVVERSCCQAAAVLGTSWN